MANSALSFQPAVEHLTSPGPNGQDLALPIHLATSSGESLSSQWEDGRPEDENSAAEVIEHLTLALSSKFEELTLIHRLSDHLTLGVETDQICQTLLEDLQTCLLAECVAIELDPDDESQFAGQLYQAGQPVEHDWLRRIAARALDLASQSQGERAERLQAALCNHSDLRAPLAVHVVVVPIRRHDKCLGRMIAIRSVEEDEFGTIEADLMKSAAMMLGAHLIHQRQYHEIQQMFEGTTQSLVSALDAKDTYTCGHSARVADLAVELARRLGFDDEGIKRIRMAGILHDIGKIGVEDSVLRKPGKLTAMEFEQIKQHPALGFEILRGIRPFQRILPAVRHHHESWDGTGYPDGLVGESIPRDAQILAVADSFDAMTSDRPYRKGLPLEKVIEILREGRGTQWAADVVDVLLACPDVMVAYATHDDRDHDGRSQ